MAMLRIWRAPVARHLVRRLTTEAAGLQKQLAAAGEWLALVQIPGAGRGLMAVKDIPQGTTVFREFPMLVAPSPHGTDQACYHCLKPLASSQAQQQQEDCDCQAGDSLARFCSPECRTSANREYWQVMRHCDFGPLVAACRHAGEKLPLMLARLACTAIRQWQSGGADVFHGGRIGGPGCEAGKVLRGNSLQDLSQLCFANVPSMPPPWRHTHALLLRGLLSHPSNSSLGSATWRQAAPQKFGVDWFCWAMSRLHINVFRIDTVPELPALDHAALLRAAAGLVSAPSAPPGHATGAGAYLLASMLNHSCEPNLEVTFPHNNAVGAFVAARDIAAGEQLCISYVDQELALEPRREALEFSYGFRCKCPKCTSGS